MLPVQTKKCEKESWVWVMVDRLVVELVDLGCTDR
jgi:hypothetical protein